MGKGPINVLIAEDDELQLEVLEGYLATHEHIRIAARAQTGDELIAQATLRTDLSAMILDIHLGEGRSGLESYSILKMRGVHLPTILVTGMAPHASVTYDLGIVDIVEKPYTAKRLRQAIEKLQSHIDYQSFVKSGGLYVPIFAEEILQKTPDDILYIESINRTILVHTASDAYESKIPIKVYESYLQDSYFYLTHRSFLVNMKKISHIEGSTIYFHQAREGKQALIAEDKIQEIASFWNNLKKWM
ncbi:LytR/AlgR family response regulator transcription factor [Brevibacillus nitrificans]|uniref:LytR/AlgR family response regulator transcription factor n=1 Tax=Brevibacillus nitrificans TaxID=651560 RepID=UPI002609718D|nr:LytTR family DNA-binding domain-containing protein [Brevibacillus nitrificans]